MVETIREESGPADQLFDRADHAYKEPEQTQDNQTLPRLSIRQTNKKREMSILESEKNKLPIHLCNKIEKTMSMEEQEQSFAVMLQNRVYLDSEEREAFCKIVIQGDGIPPKLRGQFWNLCTGVYMYQQGYCDNYYQTLVESSASGDLSKYPNQMFEKYKRDISRAFPGDSYYTDDIKAQIGRVIEAYIWRNPTVGYIQGFNFLVFRLIKVLEDEEDTFWTLVMIIETYMPPDYYVEMYGVRTQASILQKIFRQYSFLPKVQEKFDDPSINFDLMDNAISWFISIYTECLPEKASLRVLDLFFLFGKMQNRVLFNVAIGYLSFLQNQIVQADDIGVLKSDVFSENNTRFEEHTEEMMHEITSSMSALKQDHIDFYRPVCQKEAVDSAQIQKHNAYERFKKVRDQYKQDEQAAGEKIRRQFLDLFSLFEGDIRERMRNSYADPVSTFTCNPEWPMCAFNFAKKHVIPETFTYKSSNYDEITIMPDYFSEDAIEFKSHEEDHTIEKPTSVINLVIERDQHYCKETNNFINTFCSLYVHKRKQSRLFKCKQLAIKKNMTQIESHRKMMKFVYFIRDQKLSDRERIKMIPVQTIIEPAQFKQQQIEEQKANSLVKKKTQKQKAKLEESKKQMTENSVIPEVPAAENADEILDSESSSSSSD